MVLATLAKVTAIVDALQSGLTGKRLKTSYIFFDKCTKTMY